MADQYRVIVGIDYPTGKGQKRAEPGDIVDDLPKKAIEWMLPAGIVEKTTEESTAQESDPAEEGGD